MHPADIALLAPGKRVTVVAAGQTVLLPIVPPPAPEAVPSMEAVLLERLLERDAATRSANAAAAVAARETTEHLASLLQETITGQQRIVETLMLPVVPTSYDKTGRITAAQRKAKP